MGHGSPRMGRIVADGGEWDTDRHGWNGLPRMGADDPWSSVRIGEYPSASSRSLGWVRMERGLPRMGRIGADECR
ncbi:hypothetical protein [Roseiflexus castenholzii]|uniref:hypothetical protein n=1 Tax=Roseiflexus castenholzii TaxID=120962 RepID=UPI0012ECED1F|nr:hypothetical protein [Roseiflexus castenholzii]